METPHAVGEDGLAAWCEAWNDGQGIGGSLLVQLLARARALGAELIRGYAPQGDRGWDALAARHALQEMKHDLFSIA
jgi:hypothetical protein